MTYIWELSDLVTLRPLVAPSLHSGATSLAFGLLNRLVPLVLVPNYYLVFSVGQCYAIIITMILLHTATQTSLYMPVIQQVK